MLIRSYRSAFILLFVGLLVLTVLAVSSNAYRRATRVSLDLSADIIAEMSERVVDRTVDIFVQSHGFLETNALILAAGGRLGTEQETLFRLFGKQLSLLPQLQSLYVATPAGDFLQVRRTPQLLTRLLERSDAEGRPLDRPRERLIYRDRDFRPIARINGGGLFDPTTRDWYLQAVQEGLHISNVYGFERDNRPGLTLSQAVRATDAGLRFVAGADVALGSISELLAEQRLAEGGVAMIVDAADRLVAFPYWLKLEEGAGAGGGLPRVEELQARWLVDAYHGSEADEVRVSGNGAVQYSLSETNDRRYITHRQTFPEVLGTDWTLITVVPEASLLSAARRLFSESAVISLITVAVAVIAVSVLAMRLFEPLKQLVRNTEHVRDLHLDQVRRVPSRFREIETMDAAIWRMKQGLQSLEKFVPANLARQLIESDQEIRPGGEVRELALLFTGIAEMAALCARLPPERITALLTDELDRFTRVMLRLKGTIDNYLGESILAFWGAPVPVEDGAERACLAALECLRIEDELYADWDEPGLAPPRNLFSVHFGPSIVGAIGSRTRMTYTAVGDNVARGWEMRQLNHRYGTRIIVSSEVGRRVARRFWLRRLDALPLATDEGVSNAPQLELFELIDERSRPIEPARAELIERYEDALGRLLAGDWPTAEPLLEGLAARWPEDRAVQLMLERCRARDACWCPTDRAFHGTLLADVPGDSAAIGASRPTPGSPQRGDRGRTLG